MTVIEFTLFAFPFLQLLDSLLSPLSLNCVFLSLVCHHLQCSHPILLRTRFLRFSVSRAACCLFHSDPEARWDHVSTLLKTPLCQQRTQSTPVVLVSVTLRRNMALAVFIIIPTLESYQARFKHIQSHSRYKVSYLHMLPVSENAPHPPQSVQ